MPCVLERGVKRCTSHQGDADQTTGRLGLRAVTASERVETPGPSPHGCWGRETAQPLEKTAWQFLRKLIINLNKPQQFRSRCLPKRSENMSTQKPAQKRSQQQIHKIQTQTSIS